MKPSKQQQAVLDWVKTDSGSLNLIARAGCGKTSTLMMAIDAIPRSQSVSMLAFNKSIAEEIKLKLAAKGYPNVEARTLHSVGMGAWKKVAPKVQLEEKKTTKILWEMNQNEESFEQRNGSLIAQLVSIAKQSAFGFSTPVTATEAWFHLIDHYGLDEVNGREDTLEELVTIAQRVLTRSLTLDTHMIDYDDMILAPLVHNAKVWPKDWVLLDEAQDTNESRLALAAKLLHPSKGRFIAVGDDRQAIYGFTGAHSNAMNHIKDRFQSKTLYLTVTYRCPKAVVAEANTLVPDLEAHESAPEGLVRSMNTVTLQDNRKMPWFKIDPPAHTSVILCRNTKPLIQHAYDFLRHGVGCRVEGREIGEGLIKLANRWKKVTNLSQLCDKLEDYKTDEMQKWMAKGHEEKAQAVEDRVDTVLVIINKLLDEGKSSLFDFNNSVRALFGDSKPGETPRVITLSTIHKSKGREWPTVYLLDRANLLPSKYARKDWQKEQEANLEYVAITRSKFELVDLVVAEQSAVKENANV